MTARARLRAIAKRVRGFGVEAGKDADFLTALADRFDAEMEDAARFERIRMPDKAPGWTACAQALARLDASPIAPPGEPTCKRCGGFRRIQWGDPATEEGCNGMPNAFKPCPDCAPVDPEVSRCRPQCGTTEAMIEDGTWWNGEAAPDVGFCTEACALAGRPLHPAQPGGERQ